MIKPKQKGSVTKKRKAIAGIAAALGTIGSLMSICLILAALWSAALATRTVNTIFEPVNNSLGEVERRIENISAQVSGAQTPEQLKTATGGLEERAQNLNERLVDITSSPIYGNLPVDTSGLESSVAQVRESSQNITSLLGKTEESLSQTKSQVSMQIDSAGEKVKGTEDRVESVQNSIIFWIRLSAFSIVVLSLWLLWAQATLAGSGIQTLRGNRANSPKGRKQKGTK